MNLLRFKYLFYAIDIVFAFTCLSDIRQYRAIGLFELLIQFVGSWYVVMPLLLTTIGTIVVLCAIGGLFFVHNDDPRGTIAMSFVALSITVIQVALLTTVKEVDLDMRNSLGRRIEVVMARYATNDSHAMHLMDETQRRYRCCGNEAYADWNDLISRSNLACGNVHDSCKRNESLVSTKLDGRLTTALCTTLHSRGCKNLLLSHVRDGMVLLRILVFSSMFSQTLVVLCLWMVAVRVNEWHAATKPKEQQRAVKIHDSSERPMYRYSNCPKNMWNESAID